MVSAKMEKQDSQKSLAEIVNEELKNSPFKDSLEGAELGREGSISLYRQRFGRFPVPPFLKNFKIMKARVIYIYESIMRTNVYIDFKDKRYRELAQSIGGKFRCCGKKVEINYKK